MDTNVIQDSFIKNFVLKERREKSALQLQNDKRRINFADKLNHKWDTVLDMRYMISIPVGVVDFDFVKSELRIKDNELCYVISNYDDVDGCAMEFNKAFDKVYGRGFGSIIINSSGDKIYLETELVKGKQNRFIGRV